MGTEETRARCRALTRAGTQCKNLAQPDSEYCHLHQPTAQGDERGGSDEELRQEWLDELAELTERVQAATPAYQPPPFSRQRFRELVEELVHRLPREMGPGAREQLRGLLNADLPDKEALKGFWYVLNYTVQYQVDVARRHVTGEYDTDEWGLDWEFVEAARPFLSFLYKTYWRVETAGLDKIPVEGRALLVANHSGQIPWDGTMITTAVLTDHPAQRLVRCLYADWIPRLPFFSSWLVRLGQTLETEENGTRLLDQGHLVAVFPEGDKGIGKLHKDRYQLARFGDGGFVRMALTTQSSIIPVSVVGAEETYMALAKSRTLATVTGLPYVPITPRFPWLGLLGLVPLPSKWYIDVGEPIALDRYSSDSAHNLVLVAQLTDHVRNAVQEMIHARLAQRRSVFF
jgi:1-acyl-sn-glycerol-3-phosphate acyltransferase